MLNKINAFLMALIIALIPLKASASDISAQSAVVIDADTHTVIYEKNAYEPLPMASTTKIMTAIIAIECGDLDECVTITSSMLCEGSSLGLKAGDRITLNDLIKGMMLCSGNDAANAVATAVAGSVDKFVGLMNDKASEIGMSDTLFVTPSGLDEGEHHSTAYDMALLTSYAINNQIFCDIVSQKSATILINNNEQQIYNHNKLLSYDDSFFGVKTGFTTKAGRCLVSAKHFGSARLICVTLNAPNDWNDHMSLMSRCENAFTSYNTEEAISINAVGGDVDTISCSYRMNLNLLAEPQVKLYYYPFVYAPVKSGDILGYAYVYNNNILIERLPIEADEDLNYAKQE